MTDDYRRGNLLKLSPFCPRKEGGKTEGVIGSATASLSLDSRDWGQTGSKSGGVQMCHVFM